MVIHASRACDSLRFATYCSGVISASPSSEWFGRPPCSSYRSGITSTNPSPEFCGRPPCGSLSSGLSSADQSSASCGWLPSKFFHSVIISASPFLESNGHPLCDLWPAGVTLAWGSPGLSVTPGSSALCASPPQWLGRWVRCLICRSKISLAEEALSLPGWSWCALHGWLSAALGGRVSS